MIRTVFDIALIVLLAALLSTALKQADPFYDLRLETHNGN